MNLNPEQLQRRILQNTSVVIGGRLLNLVLALIPSVVLTRYLGAAQLGQYASVYAFLSLFAWLATFSTDQIAVRQAARDPGDAARIVGTGTVLAVHCSLVAFTAAVAVAVLTGYTGAAWPLLAIAAVDILLLAPGRYPGLVFQLRLRQERSVAVSTLRQVLWAGSVAVLVLGNASLLAVVAARAACGAVEAGAMFWLARRTLPFSLRRDPAAARALLRHAWPLALATLGVGIQQRIDQVLLHVWMGDRELGTYAAAVTVTELFAIIPAAVMTTMLPVLSSSGADAGEVRRLADRCFRYLGAAAFGIAGLLALGAPLIVRLLFGPRFAATAACMTALAWSLPAIFIGGTLSVVLISRGRQNLLPISTAAAAVLNVAFNAVLIPRYGGVGAAWATVASYTAANVVLFTLFPTSRADTLAGLRACAAPALACAAGALAWLLHPAGLVVVVPLAAVLYLGALRLLGVWSRADLALVINAFRPARPPAVGRP